jgi:hypothetical protein
MKVIRNIGFIISILPLLVSSCASKAKHSEIHNMIQIASYKESDESVAGLAFRTLHQRGILVGGTGGGGWICVCVLPSQADQARKILRSTLSGLSPERREHSFQVFDQ